MFEGFGTRQEWGTWIALLEPEMNTRLVADFNRQRQVREHLRTLPDRSVLSLP